MKVPARSCAINAAPGSKCARAHRRARMGYARMGYEQVPSSSTVSRACLQVCELNKARLADVPTTPLTDFFFCSQIGGLRYPSLEALVRVPPR